MSGLIISFSVLAVTALLVFLLSPGRSTPAMRAPFQGLSLAHRGLYAQDQSVPENSLPAFEAAARAGYGSELDLHRTRDGNVIVFHDDTLERLCGVPDHVEDLDYAALQKLRLANSTFGIPLFSEVLKAVNGESPLVVEIKPAGKGNEALCQAVWSILKDYQGDFCIESFDPRVLRWFRKHQPQVLRGQLAFAPKGFQNRLYGGLYLNFLGRPHFIAYSVGKKPLSVQLVEHFAMKVAWTAVPGMDIAALEKANDAIIFEYYTPKPHYK